MTSISLHLSRKIALLSFVAIILVVFIHAKTTDAMQPKCGAFFVINFIVQNFIGEGIARVAVPLFFAFSGFLFFASLKPGVNEFKRKLSSRVRTLVVPYLIWNCLGLLLLLVIQQIHGNVSLSGEKLIRSYNIIDFLSRLYPHPVQFQFWFLLDLAVYFLFSPLLYILLKKAGPIVLLGFAVLYFSKICKVYLHISDAALHTEGILFFSIGAWAAINDAKMPTVPTGVAITAFAIWVIACVFKAWLLLTIGETYGYNLVHRTVVVFGVVCVWWAYDLLPENLLNAKFLNGLIAATFFIYAFHEPGQSIMRKEILRKISVTPEHLSLCYIICPIITILVAYGLSTALKKYTPGVFRVLTGGRGR